MNLPLTKAFLVCVNYLQKYFSKRIANTLDITFASILINDMGRQIF